MAIGHFVDAKAHLKVLRELLRKHGAEKEASRWKLAHMFFANMGGFVLLYKGSDTKSAKSTHNGTQRSAEPQKDQTSAVSATQKSSGLEKGSDRSSVSLIGLDDEGLPMTKYHRYHLNAAALVAAIKHGLLSARAIPENEISDRSKYDWLARLIIILQLVNFFIDVVARGAEGLLVSPTEVAVSAFAVSALVAYGLQFEKPKDASTTITLKVYEQDEVPLEIRTYMTQYYRNEKTEAIDRPLVSEPPQLIGDSLPPRSMAKLRLRRNEDLQLVWMMGGAMGTLVGAIHLAGWDLDFPSTADKWLWRSASIATTILPPLIVLGEKFTNPRWRITQRHNRLGVVGSFAWGYGMILYAIARGILIVQMIRTLFYLSPRTYLTPNWSIDIPHIS